MTQSSAPQPPATPDNTRWTGTKAGTFLRLLARSGKVAPCARAVGMSRQSAYALRERAPAFAQYWDFAMQEAARRRASSGKGARRKAVHPLLAQGDRGPLSGAPDDTLDDTAAGSSFGPAAGDISGRGA